MVINMNHEEGTGLTMSEKDEEELTINDSIVEKEMVSDILHKDELNSIEAEPVKPKKTESHLELEIRNAAESAAESEEEKNYSNLPPYEPTLDLRDYKYPKIEQLETHGSEKIVQDPAELEANKNQIINTLKITTSRSRRSVRPWDRPSHCMKLFLPPAYAYQGSRTWKTTSH